MRQLNPSFLCRSKFFCLIYALLRAVSRRPETITAVVQKIPDVVKKSLRVRIHS
ncbi:hypothetical protein HMPREF1992_02357 [Selenomonas sp. oral taxon 892 str. F0426]|nr:hypothetical protein HMPREF1992_02357 [Selenomonas sp. oral taxon 892 str. F0426]